MAHEFTGRVLFANGRSAAGVRVRVFDKDAPDKQDDDLTVEEGVSGEDGRFTVHFSPSKFLDFNQIDFPLDLPFNWDEEIRSRRLPDVTDVYLPYLRFAYDFQSRPRSHTAFLRPFKTEFRLPELSPLQFTPSVHGYKFVNRFPGYFIPFSVPSIPDIPPVKEGDIYGLCGGMVASSLDFAVAERPIPADTEPPARATPLHQYIYRRQMDSLGAFGNQVVRFVRWMALPDGATYGTFRRTAVSWEELKASLDDGNPTPIGLVYISARETYRVWENHQVLAVSYREDDDGTLHIQLYEPNNPNRDDVTVRCHPVEVGRQSGSGGITTLLGYECEEMLGDRRKKIVRGFFPMPYTPIEPPVRSD